LSSERLSDFGRTEMLHFLGGGKPGKRRKEGSPEEAGVLGPSGGVRKGEKGNMTKRERGTIVDRGKMTMKGTLSSFIPFPWGKINKTDMPRNGGGGLILVWPSVKQRKECNKERGREKGALGKIFFN